MRGLWSRVEELLRASHADTHGDCFKGFTMASITNRDQSTPRAEPQLTGVSHHRGFRRLWGWLWRATPTAATVGALALLAFWGHRHDWTVPKFSSLVGKNDRSADDWCKEHNVPGSQCIECKAGLWPIGKDYGWCSEHGIADCPLHHPDVAQSILPPKVTSEDFDRAARALALMPRPENNSRCRLYRRRIQFASVEAVEKVGLDIDLVRQRPLIEAVAANGEVIYDETRMAHLSSRVPGTIWHVDRKIGEHVAKGDLLALVDSAEVGRAKSEFLKSIADARLKQKTVERMRRSSAAVPERTLMESETASQEARIRLQAAQQTLVNLGLAVRAENFANLETDEIARQIQFLGVKPTELPATDTLPGTSNLIPIRSSLDGIVVNRHVVEGEVVDTKAALFTIADTSHLWLTLSVRQEEAKYLRVGQSALFRPSDSKDEPEIHGALSWISTAADEQTRTVKVRVDLPNADGRLKANTFGTGRIVLREEPKAIVVPSEAVHWDGSCFVVFVRDKHYPQPNAPKFFHVRSVRPGVKQGDSTEIIAGLLPGEVIATKNSVVLESQLLKSNLGAGCACCEGH
jgi:cobalt-zinc-cadmium efflux system membrane fusion protein